MAYANDFSTDPSNGWDAVSVMNGDYADPHNRFTAHPGMPQEIGMSPAATLARARMQNEYDLGITPSDAGPRPIAMRGSSPSGPRPSQSSGPMGMGRSSARVHISLASITLRPSGAQMARARFNLCRAVMRTWADLSCKGVDYGIRK